MRKLLGLVGVTTLLIAAAPAVAIPGPDHIWNFNGTMADELGGPSMTNKGGTLGPSTYAFTPGDHGPSVSGALNADVYTIEMSFRLFGQALGWTRLISFKDRGDESGLYTDANDKLAFYDIQPGSGPALAANTFYNVVVTRDASNVFTAYLDGVQVFQFTDNLGYATFSADGNIAHFFNDNLAEEDAGEIDFIRVWDEALSAADVQALVTSVPEPLAALVFGAGLLGLGMTRRRRG